jgi:hypothetical protein
MKQRHFHVFLVNIFFCYNSVNYPSNVLPFPKLSFNSCLSINCPPPVPFNLSLYLSSIFPPALLLSNLRDCPLTPFLSKYVLDCTYLFHPFVHNMFSNYLFSLPFEGTALRQMPRTATVTSTNICCMPDWSLLTSPHPNLKSYPLGLKNLSS